jgi:hypothetical protein
VNESILMNRLDALSGATEADLIARQQIAGVIKFLRKVAQTRARYDVLSLVDVANAEFSAWGEFAVYWPKRDVYFTYKNF